MLTISRNVEVFFYLPSVDVLDGGTVLQYKYYTCDQVDSKNLLNRFRAQSVGSSNTDVLDSPCLLVLLTGTSQSKQHGEGVWGWAGFGGKRSFATVGLVIGLGELAVSVPQALIVGNFKTKENDVAKIATSVYVSNFPESISVKELFHHCKTYGHVVDSFITTKREKMKDGTKEVGGFVNSENKSFSKESAKVKVTGNFADDYDVDDQERNKFNNVGFKNEVLDCFEGDNDVEGVSKNMFQKDGTADINKDEGEFEERVEQSKDPFNIYPILNKKADTVGNDNKTDSSLKYSLGFSPIENKGDNSIHGSGNSNNNIVGLKDNNWVERMEYSRNSKLKKMSKDDSTDATSTGYFKKSEIPRTGGSILGVLEEVVNVRQIIGYKMEGCMSSMVEIIETQGAEEGNLTFDYVHSAAVGNSGSILCVWDSNSFSKNSLTMSDSFVMVRGVWRLTGQKCILIVVYALQDAKEKQMLWDYLQFKIDRWKGELEMDDFIKVVEDAWRESSVNKVKAQYKSELEAINSIIDRGNGGEVEVNTRADIINKILKIDKLHSMEMAQKAKVKWIVEGDKNSSFFHGMLNKKRNFLNIRGVMVNGVWVDNPKRVKKEFFAHFSDRFCRPTQKDASIQTEFLTTLSKDQVKEMECDVTNDEIKRVVWDCGTEKSLDLTVLRLAFFVGIGTNKQ
nr:RNA-directed DNA polymerase, eukaryota [Tanacetum cinerariifolium]